MSFFGPIFEKRSVVDTGNLTDYNDFWYGITGGPSASGISVTSQKAMRQWAVFACITLLSNTMGCFPLILKKKLKGGGSEDATDHDTYHLCKYSPNPSWTSTQWRMYGQSAKLLNGNEINWIERTRLGIKAIWPLDPTTVTIELGPNNERIYIVPKKGGGKRRLSQKDILHIPGFGFDGKQGYSFVTAYARDVIGRGLSQGDFASKYFKNGIFTSGTLEHPETLGDNKEPFINAIRERYSGTNNTGVPMILENGMKFNPMKLSLVDQQFLEQEKLNAEQICGMLHVPLHKISIPGQQNSYNNTEQLNRHFLDTTMLPWVTQAEQCYDTQLLTESDRRDGYFFKFNLDYFLRPDAKTRAEIAEIRWRTGIPVNRYLNKEDELPLDWGDKGYVPLNFVDAEAAPQEVEEEQDERFKRLPVEKRSTIQAIDKLMNNFEPSIRASAQKIVNFETIAVKRQAEKQLSQRAEGDFVSWMDEFYTKIDNIIKRDLAPILRSYWLSAFEVYADSVNDETSLSIEGEEYQGYIDGLSRQWVNASRGQLIVLLNEEENNYEAIQERMDEWFEKRAKKETEQQKRSIPNAVAYLVLGTAGYNLRWTNRGKTCAYCRALNGKIVKKGESFLQSGDEIKPNGRDSMTVKSTTKYPPLHRGCDCYLRAS